MYLALALACAAAGCSYEAFTFAEGDASTETMGETMGETTGEAGDAAGGCTSKLDCGPTFYCERPPGCGKGACKPRPTKPSTAYAPTCGCDGIVTFWNAEFAAFLGESVGASDCNVSDCTKCVGATSCLRLYSMAACTTSAVASLSCWARPADATCVGAAMETTKYSYCSAPGCGTRCDAVITGSTLWPNAACGL